MLVEVRSVKVAKFASEETLCFEAKVVIDGKVVGTVRNDGHGGCSNYEPRSLFDTLTTHAKTLPDITAYGTTLSMDADLVIDELVQDFIARKDFKKAITSRIVLVDNEGKVLQTRTLPKGTDIVAEARRFVGRPGIVHVLNLLPETEALTLFRGKAA